MELLNSSVSMKPKVAIVRGKFLNKYEMQTFEYLKGRYQLTAFGSLTSFHKSFSFPVKKLTSPMDLPEFPYKMQILNRLFIDAHYLYGLEDKLKGYDIAHTAETYYRYTQQSLDAKKKGFIHKVVVTVLENIAHNNEGIWGRKGYKQRTRHDADALIALTQMTKKSLIKEGTDPKKIHVIGSGIDTNMFFPSKSKKSNYLTVLFVGRFEVYKGVFDVLYAAEQLVRSTYDLPLKFVFVGKGSQNRAIQDLVDRLGIRNSVHFLSVPYGKIPEVYRDADIFVAPSSDTKTWKEQYGYMLLEAQASGLPIVTTKSGSIPEVVGDAALLVNQRDQVALAQALHTFLTDNKKREKYGKMARLRAEKVHDSKIIAKKIAEVYDSVL